MRGYLVQVCIFSVGCMMSLCLGSLREQTYVQVFTGYNPLLDDHHLLTSECRSVWFCSKLCLNNQNCVSFIYTKMSETSLCSLYSEFVECEIGDVLEYFYIIKGRQPRKICECNVAYNQGFVNVAFNKSVEISSIYRDLDPSTKHYMVDGDLTSIFHTNNTLNPWGMVDLGSIYDISYFYIANRISCCPERLRNFRIYVSDDQVTWSQCIYYPGDVGIDCYLRAHTTCQGRYVKIQVFVKNYFHLREFEVYTLT